MLHRGDIVVAEFLTLGKSCSLSFFIKAEYIKCNGEGRLHSLFPHSSRTFYNMILFNVKV